MKTIATMFDQGKSAEEIANNETTNCYVKNILGEQDSAQDMQDVKKLLIRLKKTKIKN